MLISDLAQRFTNWKNSLLKWTWFVFILLDFLAGGLQRCSDVFPVSRCLFALRHYDAGGKRTLEGAERLAVTARTVSEYGTSASK